MADYEVTFDAGSYNVNVDTSTPSYNLGVNYEIPSKSTQYTNVSVSYTHLKLPTNREV